MAGHRGGARTFAASMLAVALVLASSSAAAWTPPEHTLITKTALGMLLEDPATKAPLQRAWASLVADGPRKVPWPCRDVNDTHTLKCVSFADLPSLAADHSCMPSDLIRILNNELWVHDVVQRSRGIAVVFEDPKTTASQRLDQRRQMHRDFQLDDPQYLSRAEETPAHFQAAREQLRWGSTNPTLEGYLRQVLESGQTTNATALYVNFHAAALSIAAHAHRACSEGTMMCSSLATSTLMVEAFALHFLEDSFAAGHFVGQWGTSRALRMGTHDYYSDHWLEARTWKGETYVAHGDGFFADVDLAHAAPAVAASLRQVLLALDDRSPVPPGAEPSEWSRLQRAPALSDFDTCKVMLSPMGLQSLATSRTITSVLEQEPVPTPRDPEIPRFRAEFGPFLGFSGTLDSDVGSDSAGFRGRIGLRGGYGLAHIAPRGSDTHLTVDAGAAALSRVNDPYSQTGVFVRGHIPFAVVPVDGLIAMPLAAVFSDSPFLMGWALAAASGSIYGRFGSVASLSDRWSFQFAVLRDVSYFWFPHQWDLLFPVAKLRHTLPFSGAIANDVEIELGALFSRFDRDGDRRGAVGGVLSVTASTRIFLQ